MDFSGRVALVTGAAAGIGLGVASRFAEAGARVAVFDIDGSGAERAAAALPGAIAIRGDVASEADTRNAVAQAVAAFGRLDTLVNNAGIELNGTVTEMRPEDWDRQMAVNLRGVFLLSGAAIPAMRGAGGSIVNIASVHALVSYPRCPAYDTTKAGLLGLTRAMALDHGRDGIRVNVICPGYIETPLLQRWFNSLDDGQAERRRAMAAHPVGRMGTPRDIAEAVLFLASDAASFITGASLVVDGGMTIAGH
jgi:NAD(P)-dependent dehydrogenase (short-subunit alcohol dehydrogenase family)